MRVAGYPIVFDSARPLRGLSAVETVAPTIMSRSLAERQDIVCVINHDRNKTLASTATGTLELRIDPRGVRASFEIAHTVPGLELLASWARGAVTGGSFGFGYRDGHRARWHVREQPWRREMLEAVIDEVTVAVGPARPAFAETWACMLGPGMRQLQAQLDRRRINQAPMGDVSLADFTLTRAVDTIPKMWGELIDIQSLRLEREHADVKRAVAANPRARTIDVVYRRHISSALEAQRRHGPVPDLSPRRRSVTR